MPGQRLVRLFPDCVPIVQVYKNGGDPPIGCGMMLPLHPHVAFTAVAISEGADAKLLWYVTQVVEPFAPLTQMGVLTLPGQSDEYVFEEVYGPPLKLY